MSTDNSTDRYSSAYACAIELVRELNALQEAAAGVAPAHRWNGPPVEAKLDQMSIDSVPPSWLACATKGFEPASDEELWRLLKAFAVRWTAPAEKEQLERLRLLGANVGVLKVGQPVRIGPHAARSMAEAVGNAAVDIARTVNLSDATHIAHLRNLVVSQLSNFDVHAAYAGVDGEILAAEKATPAAKGDTQRRQPATVQQKMLNALALDPERRFWTQRQWADYLHCSPSAVAQAAAWQTVRKLRGQEIAERSEHYR